MKRILVISVVLLVNIPVCAWARYFFVGRGTSNAEVVFLAILCWLAIAGIFKIIIFFLETKKTEKNPDELIKNKGEER